MTTSSTWNYMQVGHWNQQSGLTFSKSFDKVKEDVSKDFQTKTFKIAVKEVKCLYFV